jgi:Fic family protein
VVDATSVNEPSLFAPTSVTQRWAPDPGSGLSRRKSKPANYEATLPPTIAHLPVDLSGATAAACSEAVHEITAVDRSMDGSTVAIAALSLLRSEAVASSRIESLRVSNRGVSLAMYQPAAAKASAREAAGNVKAMTAALAQADAAVPLSTASILQLHRVLLAEDDRGIAGRLRDEAVWVGGVTPVDAIFVPPPHEHVPALLADLGGFAARDDVDRIAKAALVHAQFEGIHPFANGNGRVGRCIVHTLLRADGVTTRTTVPVSTVLLSERDAYFAALAAYQRDGDVDAWVTHFAQAAARAAKVSEALAHDLQELTVEWHQRAGAPRAGSIARRLVDILPSQPVVDIHTVAAALEVDKRTAQRGIERLAKADVLREVTGYRRNRVWAADELFDVLDGAQLAIGRDTGGQRPGAPSRHLRSADGQNPSHPG